MEQLEYWERLLNESNFFTDILHWIGWALVKGLKTITDLSESLVDEVYGLLDFTSYAGLDKFFSTTETRILISLLLTFAIIVLGWTLIFNAKEQKPKVLQQFAIIILVVAMMPTLFSFLNDLTVGVRGIAKNSAGASVSEQIIADAVVDLKHIDATGFDKYTVKENIVIGKNGEKKNGFIGGREGNVDFIDPAEKITKDSKPKAKDILLKRIGTTETGNLVVEEIKTDKFLGIDMTNWYYRYYVDYLSIYLCLLATIITYFFTAWKVGKIIFELAFHHLLAVIMSASDLTSGQRIKTVFKSLGSIYVVLMLLPFLLKFFVLGQAYVGAHVSNGFVKGFILIAMAFTVIDGPNIIERILGIDAGIKSGFQTLATAFMLTRGATSVARGAGKAFGALGGATIGAGMGAVKDTINSFRNQRSNVETNNSGGIQEEMKNQTNSQTNAQQQSTQENSDKTSTSNVEDSRNGVTPNNSTSDAPIESGVAEQVAANNGNLSNENSGDKGLDHESQNVANNGISADVKQKMQEKGIQSPIHNAEDKKHTGLKTNPQGIIATTNRSYNNGRIVGGAVGTRLGTTAGKISNKISPSKADTNQEIGDKK